MRPAEFFVYPGSLAAESSSDTHGLFNVFGQEAVGFGTKPKGMAGEPKHDATCKVNVLGNCFRHV